MKQQSSRNRQSTNLAAVFVGWQETLSGTIALYNVIEPNHPLYQSTITEDTLRKYNLTISRISKDQQSE